MTFGLTPLKTIDCGFSSSIGVDEINRLCKLYLDPGAQLDGRAEFESRGLRRPGGTAVHGALGTLCLDGHVAIAAPLGADKRGDQCRHGLQKRGVNVEYIVQVSGLRTVLNEIYVNDGERFIVKGPGARLVHMPPQEFDGVRSLVARSRGFLAGNIPLPMTLSLGAWCQRTNTKYCVVPGGEQLADICQIRADLLVVGIGEARTATKLPEGPVDGLFDALIDLCPGVQNVVQTGGGTNSAWTFDRQTGEKCEVPPADLHRLPRRKPLSPVGAGDVAAAGTFRRLLAGDCVGEAYAHWGRPLATAHLLCRKFRSTAEFRAWYDDNASAFQLPAAERVAA